MTTPGHPPLCDTCSRWDDAAYPDPPRCEAFPDGIPDAILDGADHRTAFPGDGGLRYVMVPGAEADLAAWVAAHRAVPAG